MIRLHTLKVTKGSTKRKKRVGRGGKRGTTATRGTKGQKARSGYSRRFGFEGGKTPLVKQLPKLKGFNSLKSGKITITFSQLQNSFKDGESITSTKLSRNGLISSKNTPWKVVATGELKNKFTIPKKHTTKGAEEKIIKAGGKVTGK